MSLIRRCENVVKSKIDPDLFPDAEQLVEDILGDFAALFLVDDDPSQLDYYEVRFNDAFRSFYTDRIRREIRRRKHQVQLPAEDDIEDGDESGYDALARMSELAHMPATQLATLEHKDLLKAIAALPEPEREAVTLCHILDYKIESIDPTEETAATRCGVTGKTIRNRLARARTLLQPHDPREKP